MILGRACSRGVHAGPGARSGSLTLTLRYDHIEATYRSTFVAASPNNSSADAAGAITVHPGDHIPGIPANGAKLRAQWEGGERWAFGATVVYASSQYAHGDENNQDQHGPVPGYVVANLDAQINLTPQLQLYANITNLFNREYENFGLLGSNAFTGPGRSFGPVQGIGPTSDQFRGIGTPRAFWIGLRHGFASGTDAD